MNEKEKKAVGSMEVLSSFQITADTAGDVLKFLHAIMYPHREDFLDTVKEYIDFSQNEKLWQEVDRMSGLGMSILLEGEARGEEKGFLLGAEVFKAIQMGVNDNIQIAMQCGCTLEKVEKIREAFDI